MNVKPVLVDKELFEKVGAIADAKGVKVGEAIRTALYEFVLKHRQCSCCHCREKATGKRGAR